MDDEDPVYGIDLGTTYSCIARVDENSGKPIVFTNSDDERTTPSVVLFEDATTRVVGSQAKNTAMLDADNVVEMVKRNMGSADWRRTFHGRDYSPEEVSSYILRRLVDDVEETEGVRPRRVVITCPAYFLIPQREATAAAGTIAGLEVLEVINEPTAAAIAYGLENEADQTVLIYDLGGGTFDVTVVKVADGSVSVVATGGDHELGGRNWDELIVGEAAAFWMREQGSNDDPAEDPDTLQELWLRAEEAKRALTTRPQTRIAISHAGQLTPMTLTRERFDELTRPLLENSITYTRSVIDTAKEKGQPTIDRVLLVGGSTKMPQVRGRLVKEFGIEVVSFDPDHAVAKGAAFYGQNLVIKGAIDELVEQGDTRQKAQEEVAVRTGMLPAAVRRIDEITVTNVASHSFGIVTVHPDDPAAEQISNLVLAQQPLPFTVSRTFGTVEANQPTVDLRVVENDFRTETVDEVEKGAQVGNAVLDLAAGLPEGAPIEVTFDLNQEGRLRITGRDLAAGGKSVSAEIEVGGALAGKELKEAVAHARSVSVIK
jgi:molecular chaperone DnaK (HSP70)